MNRDLTRSKNDKKNKKCLNNVCDTRFQVVNAIHTMMQALDEGDATLFANQFVEDDGATILVEALGIRIVGRKSLETFLKNLHEKFRGCTHWEGNVVLNIVGPHEIRNRSYWKCLGPDGSVRSVGIHEDVFVRSRKTGEWKCRERVILHKNRPNKKDGDARPSDRMSKL